jgi:hypothetical protein
MIRTRGKNVVEGCQVPELGRRVSRKDAHGTVDGPDFA